MVESYKPSFGFVLGDLKKELESDGSKHPDGGNIPDKMSQLANKLNLSEPLMFGIGRKEIIFID